MFLINSFTRKNKFVMNGEYMTDIVMSICIPTYNRVQQVTNCVKRIISGCNSKEIEVVVSDNASIDGTKKEISKIRDPRLKYYRNNKNLGIGGNLLKIIERSNGNFIFIHWDDDYIELDTIPWILKTIKENNNINQILGTIKRFGKVWWSCNKKLLCAEGKDEIIEPGPDSLARLLFTYYHGGARIFRRESINLDYGKKYIGTALAPFMHQILEVYPVLSGSTLCTYRTLYHVESKKSESVGHIFKGKAYWNPLNRLYMLRERIRIIQDVTNRGSAQRVLLNRQREYAVSLIFDAFYKSLSFYRSFDYFIKIIIGILQIKVISRSPVFWFTVLHTTIYDILRKIGFIRFFKIECPRSIHVSLG